MSKRPPPALAGRVFRAREDLVLHHLKSLSIPGTGAGSEQKLESFGWNGKIISYLSLSLSNDNKSVSNGSFNLIGSISDSPLVFPTKKLWDTVNDTISLQLSLPNGRDFPFSEGGLVSDYVDSTDISFSFFNNKEPTNPIVEDPETLRAHKIGDFCLRAFGVPTSTNFVKLFILFFPASAEEVLSHPLGKNPAWPGILLFSGQVPLFPPSSCLNLAWGQPILPLFLLGAPLSDLPHCPPSRECSGSIAAILRTCASPITLRTTSQLLPKWEELDSSGASKLQCTQPEKIWPPTTASPTPPPRHGNHLSYCVLCNMYTLLRTLYSLHPMSPFSNTHNFCFIIAFDCCVNFQSILAKFI